MIINIGINALYGVLVLLAIGLLLGFLLAFADAKLSVKEDERVETLTTLLPGYNCGSCGYPSCQEMATAILKGEVKQISQCRPSRPNQREAIKEYLKGAPDAKGEFIDIQ